MKSPSTTTLAFAIACLCALGAGSSLAATAPGVSYLPPISGHIATPVRLANDAGGNLYLTDPRAGGVLVFGNDGTFLRRVNTLGKPQGIAVTAGGDLVLSQGTYVSVLSAGGTEKFQLGVGAGQFKMANGIALDANGYIYVVDSLDNCVQVFSGQGAPVAVPSAAPGKPANSFGSLGRGPGQFYQPTAIAFEPAGNQLAVVDTLNNRVQFFTSSGVFLRTLGSAGLGPLKFSSPQGIGFGATDSGVIMYLADAFQSNIQAIDLASGGFLRVIGSFGTGSGKLMTPTDLVFDSFDSRNPRLVVANGFGNLALFGIQSPVAPGSAGGPALSINTLPLATNLSSLTLSGTVAANATLRISVSSSAVVGPIAPGINWSASVTGLVPGNNQFTVTATDTQGNSTTASVTAFVIATTGNTPVTPLSVDALPSLTATAAQTLSGTVQPGSSVSVNGIPASVSGSLWSYQTTLNQGVNSFLIQAAHPAFIDATASINITLNGVAPVLNLATLPNGSTTSSQLLSLSGTVVDSLPCVVNILVNGQSLPAIPVVGGAFSAGAFLAVGNNAVEVKASDAAGNQSPVSRFTVNFVPSAPQISIGFPDGSSSAGSSLKITGSASAGSVVALSVSGASVPVSLSGTSWSALLTLAPGPNTVLASATLGGVTSLARANINFDPQAPPLAISSPAQNAVLTGGPGQSVGVTGTSGPGISLLATLDGASLPVSVAPSGNFSVALLNLGIGSHTVALTAIDALGNSSSALRTIVVSDPTPPQVTLDAANPLRMSVGPGVTLVVRDKNGPVPGAVTTIGGVSTLDLSAAPGYDPASLSITAVTPGGGSSRNGVLVSGEAGQAGTPSITDAVEALKLATGGRPAGLVDKMHGDVAPLVNGLPIPDGRIDIEDVVVIMMRVVGKPW
jgi:DNA-binding beta-propeller fold protein YncE